MSTVGAIKHKQGINNNTTQKFMSFKELLV